MLLLATLVLAACQPADEEAPPSPASTASPASPANSASPAAAVASGPITTPEELSGYYRIAGIDGAEIEGSEGFGVRFTEDRVMVLAQCIKTEWLYRFEGERIVVTVDNLREPCRRALSPDERAIASAFDGMERASRTPANAILIEGSGGSLTLFSQ